MDFLENFSGFDMTWLDKGLRLNLRVQLVDFLEKFDMTWLDKGLRPVIQREPLPNHHGASLIWPDLIRDYDTRTQSNPRLGLSFDMTWLDKGLRRKKGLGWLTVHVPFDMTWLDKGLRHDTSGGSTRSRAPGFDMTWLDKGLRRRPRKDRKDAANMVWYDLTW